MKKFLLLATLGLFACAPKETPVLLAGTYAVSEMPDSGGRRLRVHKPVFVAFS